MKSYQDRVGTINRLGSLNILAEAKLDGRF